MTKFTVMAALAVGVFTATHAASQEVVGTPEELRARQEALFDRMLVAPDDLELMFDHALVSIALNDYEAAISTLERMLIFNPSLNRAKVELGAAYFRLGAYENARYYFEDALATGDPPPEVVGRVNQFLAEIEQRTQETGFFGVATIGITASSNANLGPNDGDILLDGAAADLADEFIANEDVGVRAALYGSHYYDLGQPDGDLWRTDLTLFSVHYLEESAGDIDSVQVRSGPRLSLDDRRFGPKLRPFVDLDALRSDNEWLYTTIGVGAEYTDTLDERTNVFLAARSAYREYYQNRDEFDGSTHRIVGGARYAFDKNTAVAGSIYAEADLADDDENTNLELGVRFGGVYNYDPGYDFTDRLWSISGYMQIAGRWYDEPLGEVDPNRSRNDIDYRVGLSHVFHLREGWFIQADGDVLIRDSNLPNFDLDNFGATISVGRSF